MRARKSPNYDLSCFCAQQSAEKYLKALLAELERPIPKIHDLIKLRILVSDAFPELTLLDPALEVLSVFAVEFRYPGPSATKSLARQAYLDCELARETVRRLLKLPNRNIAKGSKRI
jgi:HEPN domain-containing protein